MTLILLTPEGKAAGFDQCAINRALERYASEDAAKVVNLPPSAWADDTSGGSGAPASAGCV
jgi:hypothetical protein